MADWAERFSLAGRRALVTGATRGIGAQIARVFADAGADVALVGRDEAALAETAAAVRAKGREALTISADLSTAAGDEGAARDALARCWRKRRSAASVNLSRSPTARFTSPLPRPASSTAHSS